MAEIKFEYPNLNRFEQERKEIAEAEKRSKLQLKERKKLKRNLVRLILIIGIIIAVGLSIKLYYNYSLAHNRIEIEGKIISVNHQEERMNDMDGTWINSYYIVYQFKVDGKNYNGFQEIGSSELHEYFSKVPSSGDQILVIYDPANIKNNHIAGIKNEW